jgi:hypothetical protein
VYLFGETADISLQSDLLAFGESDFRSGITLSAPNVINDPSSYLRWWSYPDHQLFTCLLLPITMAALEFAVHGFVTDVQPSRTVGDGAVFSSTLTQTLYAGRKKQCES